MFPSVCLWTKNCLFRDKSAEFFDFLLLSFSCCSKSEHFSTFSTDFPLFVQKASTFHRNLAVSRPFHPQSARNSPKHAPKVPQSARNDPKVPETSPEVPVFTPKVPETRRNMPPKCPKVPSEDQGAGRPIRQGAEALVRARRAEPGAVPRLPARTRADLH